MARRYYTINLRPGSKFLRLTKSIEVNGPRVLGGFAPSAGVIKPDGKDATWFSTIGGMQLSPPRDGWRIRFEWTA